MLEIPAAITRPCNLSRQVAAVAVTTVSLFQSIKIDEICLLKSLEINDRSEVLKLLDCNSLEAKLWAKGRIAEQVMTQKNVEW